MAFGPTRVENGAVRRWELKATTVGIVLKLKHSLWIDSPSCTVRMDGVVV